MQKTGEGQQGLVVHCRSPYYEHHQGLGQDTVSQGNDITDGSDKTSARVIQRQKPKASHSPSH
jgi:hypothetical protein